MILRGSWCDIIVLIVHASTGHNIDDMKDRFYDMLERVFGKYAKYNMKILLGYFSAEVGREDIFKSTISNDSLHEIVMITSIKLCHIQKSY
jgi:hypothetical protein